MSVCSTDLYPPVTWCIYCSSSIARKPLVKRPGFQIEKDTSTYQHCHPILQRSTPTRAAANSAADFDATSIEQFALDGTGTMGPGHILTRATVFFWLRLLGMEIADSG